MDKNYADAARDKFCYHVNGEMETPFRETDSTSEFMKEGAQVWGKLQLSAGERLCNIYKLQCLWWSRCPKGLCTENATAESILKVVIW